MCYYFDDIIKLEDFDLDNILIDKKPYENILIYNISYKALIDRKPLCIWFNKIDGFIRIYDGTRYLTLFDSEKNMTLFATKLDTLSAKKMTSHIFFLGSYDSLPIEKMLTLHNVIIHIKSVPNKDKNHYQHCK